MTIRSIDSDLRQRIKGDVINTGDPGFDKARQVWNAMIDRHPAAIVRCADAADVAGALAFARERGLDIAVRGGGHNIAGSGVCDGGIVIDLSRMSGVEVDPKEQRASVMAGATLAQVDAATQRHGLATPLGINSTTGVAGLTLGGGFGWLTRRYGMTIDNLLSADVVTVAGTKVRASESEHADLFWALRGGGGNFGIVTRFEFRLHPVGPQVVAGLLVYPLEQAGQVLWHYREFVETAPEELTVWAIVRGAPPLPFLPQRVHGTPVIALAVFFSGEPRLAERHVEALRRFGDLHGEHVGLQPYSAWQQAFDPLLTAGARNYWKSHNLTEISDDARNCLIRFGAQLPSAESEIFVALVAGAPNRVPRDAMAYGHRDARFVLNVHARWQRRRDDGRCVDWARRFFDATAPFASSGAYVNFMTEEEGGRVASAYGANYARLVELKQRYDPRNLLRCNQNITPRPTSAPPFGATQPADTRLPS